MASAQEAGIVRVYAVSPSGNKKKVFSGHVSTTAPAGGAADGALGSVSTPEKRINVPVRRDIPLRNDWVLQVTFQSEAADGIDVSDSIWSIPITIAGQGVEFISQGDFANPAAADLTMVADIEQVVAGYKVTQNLVYFGGGPLYIDMQDDTA